MRRRLLVRALWGFAEVAVSLGVVLLLLVAHQLWWTNRLARDDAGRTVQALEREWGAPVSPSPPGPEPGVVSTPIPVPGPSSSAAFLQTMDQATQHWFVLVRAGDAGAHEGTLLLTPAVERYVQAFAEGRLFHTPHVTEKVMDLFEELTAHPALPRPMAADHYLASGYIPYQPGVAKGASTIGNAVIRRNPGSHVGAEFVFTPEMTGCALAVTDVTDDTFRAWHYQSPNGMSQRQFAAAFRAERSPTDWFGDASYLGPMPDGY
ncbi:hypothetical protein ABZ943_41270, partial [Streptomyces rubiginosohelvolus]